MSENKSIYYYEVAVVLPATWKQHVYTYSSEIKKQTGNIVYVPFGKSEKQGYIVREISKPEYKTKPITSYSEYLLPEKTISYHDWISEYYPSSPGVHVQHFVPSFLNKPPKRKLIDRPISLKETKSRETLTNDQKRAYDELTKRNSPKSNILHGITGSGKTRLYCEIAAKYLDEGSNCVILYPEISLTSQIENVLKEYFGEDRVLVYHSKLTASEQWRTWTKVHNNKQPMIIIGPRSALFLPHSNLGLVIVDEAHDGAYKQDSGTRYNGLVAAGALARQHDAKFIFGSATPPVQETEQILSKGGSLVCMHNLAKESEQQTKTFEIIDMTKSINKSKSYLISKQLMSEVKKSLQNKKQSLLFINKRGTARMLLCEDCGWHAECPNCEMPLTHHHDSHTLQCSVCGYKRKSYNICPECSGSLILKNPGIKSVEQDLRELFPDAKIARFDSDNKKKDTFSENYENIRSGGADILIGTQLLTKGLDLPLLETVGILQADSALLLPDYTSEERAFQQLSQVSGRVGRGHSSGHVVVQTYQPTSYLFKYITNQDWHGFYEQELEKRSKNRYPPYSFVIKIWGTKKTQATAISAVTKFVSNLESTSGIRILGPAPSFYEKVANNYSWQVIIMSSNRKKLTNIVANLPSDFYFDIDPISLL